MFRRVSTSFEKSDPPEGFFAASGAIASKVIDEVKPSNPVAVDPHTHRPLTADEQTIFEQPSAEQQPHQQLEQQPQSKVEQDLHQGWPRSGSSAISDIGAAKNEYDNFANGYHFPPRRRWQESWKIGTISFLKYSMTPLGFAVVVYMLLVIAFGGMIFLLICGAAPAMCNPTCNDINSPRRKWIEYCSQILNGLFCVTGFGLAPWRIRDLYWLLKFRLEGDKIALRRLAGIHRAWFRLEGSQNLSNDVTPATAESTVDPSAHMAVPFPLQKIPEPPLTGIRAPPTKLWKMDYVIWMYIGNTVFQACLAGFEWGMDRYTRPGVATGVFVGVGMITGCLAGWMQFREGRSIKHIEGVAVTADDLQRLKEDRDKGVQHYNNIRAKKPKNDEHKLSMVNRMTRVTKSRTATSANV